MSDTCPFLFREAVTLFILPKFEAAARKAVRYGLYPLSWTAILIGGHHIWTSAADPRTIASIVSGSLLALYLLIELTLPYEKRWAMTWASFLADLKYIAINGVFGVLVTIGLGWLAITISGELNGPARAWNPAIQLGVCLLVFEAIYYTMHRAMHERGGRFGAFLWRSHAAHHLPPRLYLVMHGVFHPLNSIAVRLFATILPIWLLGFEPKVIAMFAMISGVHGSISHFNVDIRAGWMNYLFIGTELHRYHHSADVNEGRNYGSVLAIYDVLFGTFVYRPGIPPKELGISAEQKLPPYESTLKVMMLPFVR
jgi:sterol desaturase/sphingolipid hydroxylase (fatty acid hydroxylase superfamily)